MVDASPVRDRSETQISGLEFFKVRQRRSKIMPVASEFGIVRAQTLWTKVSQSRKRIQSESSARNISTVIDSKVGEQRGVFRHIAHVVHSPTPFDFVLDFFGPFVVAEAVTSCVDHDDLCESTQERSEIGQVLEV